MLCRSKLSASEALLLREVFPDILAVHRDQVWSWFQRRFLERLDATSSRGQALAGGEEAEGKGSGPAGR